MPLYRYSNGAWRQGASVLYPNTSSVEAALPTGPDYIHYDVLRARATLGGAVDPDLQTVFDTLVEPKIVTMPPGVFETKRKWGKAPYYSGATTPQRQAALLVPKVCRGIWGSGRGSVGSTSGTIIRVTPMTCQSASEGGSWFQTGGSGSGDFLLKNLHIEGTEQGNQTAAKADAPGYDGVSRKLFTNYFEQGNRTGQYVAEDILSNGSYGNNGAPPGETFNFQVYNADYHILRRVETDGRRAVGGPSFSSVGITAGNCYGAEWYDCWAHHINAKTYHMVYYQTMACKTFNCRLGDSSDLDGYGDFGVTNPSPTTPGFTGGGFNQERAGDSEHYGLNIYSNRKGPNNPDKGVHFNHSGDDWSRAFIGDTMRLVDHQYCLIQDATWFNHWGKTGNPLYVSTWIPYSSNPNAITVSPTVINNGVPQRIAWSPPGYSPTVLSPYQM